METTRKLDTLFPTFVHVTEFEDKDFFKTFADMIMNEMGDIQLQTLESYDAVPTADHLHTLKDFQPLFEFLDKETKDFFKNYLGIDKKSTHMSCMWANVQRRKSKHGVHTHPNSFWSGVLYIDIPEGYDTHAGNLVFVDPRPGSLATHYDSENARIPTIHNMSYVPKTGMLILFPSWLQHGTTTCHLPEGEYRISLSFNYQLDTCEAPTMKINPSPLLKSNIFYRLS
jgi:uncharacterized protein (TIGR02466 family)